MFAIPANDDKESNMTDITQLPIYKHQNEINEALANHSVIVVQGPTGCGKTTQLPRILLRNPMITGRIGLTQPRRIAAVSVSMRIAKEIGCELGQEVGYAIRFDDKTSDETIVKVMTDGILLQESRTDHLYNQYQVIIIDEAHERSLNIDLAMGLLKLAIEERPELRVIISSATIRAETFQKYFSRTGDGSDVPLISIQARTYPVDIEYRNVENREKDDIPSAVADEVRNIHKSGEPGHILCFLPGQAMITAAQEMIQTMQATQKGFSDLWVLPLYGLLPREEQEKVFDERPNTRKVVLATNIAETSITIPDVRFVIDSGIAKIPRFNNNTHVTTLKEEPISQASMAQRAGRAGRTAPGKCIRLFSEDKRDLRPAFTDEEIIRLELSEVLLRLIDVGIYDVESFPFPTRPPKQAIRDALAELRRLGAIDETNHLTSIGQKMVVFPLSPRLARVVIEAGMKYPASMHDVIIAVAWLSVKSPLQYPPGHEAQARRAHGKLAHAMGDLLTAVNVVHKFVEAEDKKQFCYKNFLEFDTMAFIDKSVEQIEDIAETVGLISQPDGQENDVIKAFLAAYGDQCLVLKGRSYVTPTDINVVLHPSSSLYESMPKLILALEFIQSARIYAEQASALRTSWLKEYDIQIDMSQDSSRPGRGAYQEYGANRKKQKRFERSREALGYDENMHKTSRGYDSKAAQTPSIPTSNGRKLFRVQNQPVRPEIRGRNSAEAAVSTRVPNELLIGGRTLTCVTTSHRQPLIIMTIDELRAIASVQPLTDERSWLNYRVSLRDNFGKYELLHNFRLGEIVDVARALGLLEDKLFVPDSIPIGASLSIHQNLRVLLRALPFIGRCHIGARGKNGWLTIANAEDIFWFEFNDKATDALDISTQTLQILAEDINDADALENISRVVQRLSDAQKKIRAAVEKNY